MSRVKSICCYSAMGAGGRRGTCDEGRALAAMRLALPEANSTIALSLTLGMTFPFNPMFGISLYLAVAGGSAISGWGRPVVCRPVVQAGRYGPF
jgi:hypothetical protein